MKKRLAFLAVVMVAGAGFVVAAERYPWLQDSAMNTFGRVTALLPFTASAATENAVMWRTAPVERGAIQSAVLATGSLQPVQTVQVSSQVSGQLVAIVADFNAAVKAGDVIARLDPTTLQGRLASAEADLAVAQATIETKRSALDRAKAERSRVEEARVDAERSQERARLLFRSGSGTERSVELADVLARQTGAQARSSDADIAMAEAELVVSKANVAQREAAVRIARTDLERTNIRAPIAGVVIDRQVELGQTVAASLAAPTLFVIAADLREMQLEASIDEADVGRVREGQAVTFTVDAYPGRGFDGKVTQVRRAAKTVQNVVTYTAVVTADNSLMALFPGMTANVRLIVERKQNALKVPQAAIRFRPNATSPAGDTQNRERRARTVRSAADEGTSARVHILKSDGTLEAVPVKVGIATESEIEIVSEAIKAGDQVAIGRQDATADRRRNAPLGF